LFANFLIGVGITGAVIAFVWAGILYFTSGFNANAVTKAKELFKYTLIGILLIVGAGVIINTVAVIITGDFFGLGSGNPAGGGGGGGGGGAGELTGGVGEPCSSGNCSISLNLICKNYSSGTICVRPGGNLTGEGCKDIDDCKVGLTCQQYQHVCVPE
jgi:hypothetical protein